MIAKAFCVEISKKKMCFYEFFLNYKILTIKLQQLLKYKKSIIMNSWLKLIFVLKILLKKYYLSNDKKKRCIQRHVQIKVYNFPEKSSKILKFYYDIHGCHSWVKKCFLNDQKFPWVNLNFLEFCWVFFQIFNFFFASGAN